MRCLVVVLGVLGALWATPWAWTFQDPCQDEGKRAIDELVERWTWELFWDGGTSGFQYQPRANARADVFWNPDLIGMCSPELGTCTAYERNGARLGQFALSGPLRGPEIRQATETFLRRLNEPRVILEGNSARSGRQPESSGHFEGGGTVVEIPTPPDSVVVQRNATGFQTCPMASLSFPALGPPKAVRKKTTPENLGAFERWLEGRPRPPAGATAEYVIPYYAPSDPLVYVLVRVNRATESVIFVVPGPSGTGWRIGGHFDPKESPAQVRRLEPLILSAKMTSVVR